MSEKKLRTVAIFVYRHHLAASGPPAQRGVRLHRKTVQREMLGLEPEGPLQVGGPVPAERGGQTEDEVNRKIGDAGASQCLDRAGIWSTVWVRCIHPSTPGSNDCTPRETRFTPAARQAAAAAEGHIVRIGFQGDLGIAGHGSVGRYPFQHPRDRRRRHPRRGASTEVDRLNLGRRGPYLV